MKHLETAAKARIETADDAEALPQGLKLGAGQLRLADKLSLDLGTVDGSMSHHMLTGMIAYILSHPDYSKAGGFNLADFKLGLKKAMPSMTKALSIVETSTM